MPGESWLAAVLVSVLSMFVAPAGFCSSPVDASPPVRSESRNAYGFIDALAYGAFASGAKPLAAMRRGSPIAVLAEPGDFGDGQFVAIPGAGPVASIKAPTNPKLISKMGAALKSTGNTSYRCKVTAVDGNEGESPASPIVAVADGNDELGGQSWNVLSWDPVQNADHYRAYCCRGPSCAPTFAGLAYNAPYFADYGEHLIAPSGIAPPSAATQDTLFTRIVSGGGTAKVTLAAPSSADGSFPFEHDNATPIQAALNAAKSTLRGRVFLPAGQYNIARTITETLSAGLAGTCATSDPAPTSEGTSLVWQGTDASVLLRAIDMQNSRTECLRLDARTTARGTPTKAMIGMQVDGTSQHPSGGAFESRFENLAAVGGRIGILNGGEFCPQVGTAQPSCDSSNAIFQNIVVDGAMRRGAQGITVESSNAGDLTTYDHIFSKRNAYGFESFNRANLTDLRFMNCAMIPGATCIDLQDGSGIDIFADQDEPQIDGDYSIRVRGYSFIGNAIEIHNAVFTNDVSIDVPAMVLSHNNVSWNPKSVYRINTPGAYLISLNDNLWGRNGKWTTTGGAASNNIIEEAGRNNSTSEIIHKLGGNWIVDRISNNCSGRVALIGGIAKITNDCITGSRPIIVTEETSETPNALGYSQGQGFVTIRSSLSSDHSTVSWSQQ